MHNEGYNGMMSFSLLSALSMERSTVVYSLMLVAQVTIIIVYTPSVFFVPPQANYSAFGTLAGPNEQIVFFSERDGNQEIYVMNAADGSNQTRLTYNDVQDTGSTWSPDGTKIAFASARDGNIEIYLMNASDGSGQTRLTNNTATDAEPDW